MLSGITNALRGIGGEFEITRVMGALGTIVYIIGAHVFVVYQVWWQGKEFNLTEYCIAFPGGLAACVATIAGAAAVKDNQVAKAQVTRETGAIPTAPPAGPQVPTEERAGELPAEERIN